MKYKRDHNDIFTLMLCGDVMTGRGIDQILQFTSDPELHESYIKNAKRYVELAERKSGLISQPVNYEYIWGDALEVIDTINPALKILNLETAITSSNHYWPGKGIHYRMHPRNVQVLKAAGIDISVIGNNHILDWGYDGLAETIHTLSSNEITCTGAGMNNESASEPAVYQTDEGRLLVFSYATLDAGVLPDWRAETGKAGVNLLPRLTSIEFDKVASDVDRYRKSGDRVIISMHWGGNWGYAVSAEQRRFAHKLIGFGYADLIHGHSSHHPKSIEVHRGRLILYGCGDLINDYEGIRGHEEYRGELSLLYYPELDATGRLVSLIMVPFKMNRFRLGKVDSADRDWLADRMNRECSKFGSSIHQDENGCFVLKWQDVISGTTD
jgi:poly-gamma-glutamate capsule biosynthesis protein CapA/YwtB (metallophosphatase superfamily)